jgi:hypothetical protein
MTQEKEKKKSLFSCPDTKINITYQKKTESFNKMYNKNQSPSRGCARAAECKMKIALSDASMMNPMKHQTSEMLIFILLHSHL